MPKEKRRQPPAEDTVRQKRPRQQSGYYTSLLSGEKSRKSRSKNTNKDNQPHITKASSASHDKPTAAPPAENSDDDASTAQGSTTLAPPPSPLSKLTHQPCTAKRCEGAGPAEGQVESEGGRQRDKTTPVVRAVVKDLPPPSPSLLSQLGQGMAIPSPWQEEQVEVTEEKGQMTITGSMEQVLQVLQTLNQMKNTMKGEANLSGESSHPQKERTVDSMEGDDNMASISSAEPAAVATRQESAQKATAHAACGGADERASVQCSPLTQTRAVATRMAALECSMNGGDTDPEDELEGEDSMREKGPSPLCVTLGGPAQNHTYAEFRTHELLLEVPPVSPEEEESLIKDSRTKSIITHFPPCTTEGEKPVKKSPAGEILEDLSGSGIHANSPQTARASTAGTSSSTQNEECPGRPPISVLFVATVRCGICYAACMSEEEIKTHFKVVHDSTGMPFCCGVCCLAFPFKRSLLTHLKTEHCSPDQTCLICGKKFQCARYLLTHLLRHAGVKKFECPICGWRFFERHKLKFHLELHKSESERQLPYSCQLCNKKFVNRASWSDHCNTHSGHRPFTCDTCGAKFSHRVGLRRHKLTHETVKPFPCPMCPRSFTVKPKLDQHMITHTGVSKHVCPLCSRVFTTSSSVKRHQRKCQRTGNSEVKQEDETAISVQTSTDLSPDENPASENTVFVCGECNHCFSTYDEAEQHILAHRTEEGRTYTGGQDQTPSADEVLEFSDIVSVPPKPASDILQSLESVSKQAVEENRLLGSGHEQVNIKSRMVVGGWSDLKNHCIGDQVITVAPMDSQPAANSKEVVLQTGTLNMAEVEEQTQQAANTLACLSAM